MNHEEAMIKTRIVESLIRSLRTLEANEKEAIHAHTWITKELKTADTTRQAELQAVKEKIESLFETVKAEKSRLKSVYKANGHPELLLIAEALKDVA